MKRKKSVKMKILSVILTLVFLSGLAPSSFPPFGGAVVTASAESAVLDGDEIVTMTENGADEQTPPPGVEAAEIIGDLENIEIPEDIETDFSEDMSGISAPDQMRTSSHISLTTPPSNNLFTASVGNGYGSEVKFLAPIEPVQNLPDFEEYIAIGTREELEAIRDNMRGKYYLTADIDLSGEPWSPIGKIIGNGQSPEYFSGTFDGQGYRIFNLSILGEPSADYQNAGLFALFYGRIKNVGLEGTTTILNFDRGYQEVGGLCGRLNGFMDNCYNAAEVISVSQYGFSSIGGLCGRLEGRMENCFNTVDITMSAASVGGICGFIKINENPISDLPEISRCYNLGNIVNTTSSGGAAGGICAGAESGTMNSAVSKLTIENCYNRGSISFSTGYGTAQIGGICGVIGNHININACYNAGFITNTHNYGAIYIGGICGSTESINQIKNCYNIGDVAALTEHGYPTQAVLAAGICASYYGIQVENCYSTGNISSSSLSSTPAYAGGIIARSAERTNCSVVLSNSIDASATGEVAINNNLIGGGGQSELRFNNIALTKISGNPIDDTGDGSGGARISVAEAKDRATYDELGWDFDTTWKMVPGVALPQLMWQTEYTEWDALDDDDDDGGSPLRVISVTSPANANISHIMRSIKATVDNSVSSLTINLAVTEGATWELYDDATCEHKAPSHTSHIFDGENKWYIKLSADEKDDVIYSLTLTRAPNSPVDINVGHKQVRRTIYQTYEPELNKTSIQYLYEFDITADIKNNNNGTAKDVKLMLNKDNDLRLADSETAEKSIGDLAAGVSDSVTWRVTVSCASNSPDKNLNYSVKVEADNTPSVENFGSIFIDGTNTANNILIFGEDTWNFANYGAKPIPISTEDLNAFKYGMTNSEKSLYDARVNEGAGGYCYGMAITSVLAKVNRLNLADIQAGASNLSSINKNNKAKSVIGYYYLTQWLQPHVDHMTTFDQNNTTQKLEIVRQLADSVDSGGVPFVLIFWIDKDNDGEFDDGGHAVTAYSSESGSWPIDGTTYNSRILIYDNNQPNWDTNYCLYFNVGTSEWTIPAYCGKSSTDGREGDASLGGALADINLMDINSLDMSLKNVKSAIRAKNNTDLLVKLQNNITFTINSTGTNPEVGISIFPDLADGSSTINIYLDNSEQPFIISPQVEGDPLDLSVKYNGIFALVETASAESANFSPDCKVGINENEGEFRLLLASDTSPLKWYEINANGSANADVSLELGDNGYILSGDDLNDIQITGKNDDEIKKLMFSTEKDKVLIGQQDDELVAFIDNDGNGTYESPIAKSSDDIAETPAVQHTITFDGNGGTSSELSRSVTHGAPVGSLPTASRDKYSFNGWFSAATGGANISPDTIITDNVTVYAQWTLSSGSGGSSSGGGGGGDGSSSSSNSDTPPGTSGGSDTSSDGASTVASSGNSSSSISESPASDSVPDKGKELPFVDVLKGAWFYSDVAWAYGNSLMVGTSATEFSPNISLTRGMLVTVLHRLAGEPAAGGGSGFSDVSEGLWYSKAVAWARENGIVSGVGNNIFAPNDSITREQAATILLNYANHTTNNAPQGDWVAALDFADTEQISEWALNGAVYCYANGIITGKPASSVVSDSEHQLSPQGSKLFDPQGQATRAEIAAILHRYVEAVGASIADLLE
jgi:uncharacterized repeat protein (TIGR02543 family)